MLKNYIFINILERIRLLLIKTTRLLNKKVINIDKNKKKIIFNTQYIWAFSELEFFCASQLYSQGHQVLMVICDDLPYTEREIFSIKNVLSLKKCSERTLRYCKAYGLNYLKMSNFLDEKDRVNAKKISQKKINEIENYKIGNINIGELSKRNHAHYYKGDLPLRGEYELFYRRIFESALLIYFAFSKILKKYKNFNLISANGKFIQTAIPSIINKNLGNNFYTYEVFGQGNGVILDKNKMSLEQRLDDVWDELKIFPLSKTEREKLYHSFKLQEKSLSSPFQLWDENIINNKKTIKKQLGINSKKIILVCFTHVYWDSTHMGLKAVSADMMTWLEEMIHFVDSNKKFQLIIRSHPGEKKVPYELKARLTIEESLKMRMNRIPSNVKIISSENNISSYKLAEIADVNLVWNSTIGIELALKGIKPFVVADAYYSKKGFTNDYLNFKKLTKELLNLRKKNKLNEISLMERKILERFCYEIRFNRKFNAPFYSNTKCILLNYRNILKGSNSTLDKMVGFYLDENNYMKIGKFNFM